MNELKKPTATRRYEIYARIKDSDMLLVNEYWSDGSCVAKYKAKPLRSGDVPVYILYPMRGGLYDAGRVRPIRYQKKMINQLDIFAVNTRKVYSI